MVLGDNRGTRMVSSAVICDIFCDSQTVEF